MAAELKDTIDLLALGRETTTKMAQCLERGGSAFKCQLIASRFYEALRAELKRCFPFQERHRLLTIAVDRCKRASRHGIPPATIFAELNGALAMLDGAEAGTAPLLRFGGRPMLRVIQGGLT
jgi:hypothetical protein